MFKKLNGRKIYSSLILTLLITMLLTAAVFSSGAEAEKPKYVFFFIGDGLSSAQATLAEYYTQFENREEPAHDYEEHEESYIDHSEEKHSDRLMMHRLDHEGSTRTSGADTLVPGSAQTATALA
ncbi:MAG: alkaline phosphatase, partial [Halanaerobium sp.]